MEAELVLFAIDAGVRLGKKLHEVLLDETQERRLLLPVGELWDTPEAADAAEFFGREKHRVLVTGNGPYAGFNDHDLTLAYRSIVSINRSVGAPDESATAIEIVRRLDAFEQYRDGFGKKPGLQRVLGTLVEIGIDYFAANPRALGRDSSERRILHAFIVSIEETDFAEGSAGSIVGALVTAGLHTLSDNPSLVGDDKRLEALIGGVTKALYEDMQAITSQAGQIKREDLIKRIGASILRGGAAAFTTNIDLFLRDDSTTKALVRDTLGQFLEGIRGQEDLFTNESLEVLFHSALKATAENVSLFSDKKLLQDLIKSTVEVLTSTQGSKLFSEETVAAILEETLAVASENMETLFDAKKPRQQLLASALSSVAAGLSATLAGGGTVKDLLSKQQLLGLVKIVFAETAKHPEKLLGGDLSDARKTAIAQIIGSVARALGDDPTRFVNGDGLLELVESTLEVSVLNADKLLDLDATSPKTNLLFAVLEQVVGAVTEEGDPRRLVTRGVFLEIAQRVLPVVSANLDPLLAGADKPVKAVVARVLELAGAALENRINGANIPVVIEELLLEVLWGELNLSEDVAVTRAANRVLRAA